MRRVLAAIVVGSLACACGSAMQRSDNARVATASTENQRARALLCGDIGTEACLAACSDSLASRDHGACLLEFRFAADPEALRLARALYLERNTRLGVETRSSIEGFRGELVATFPALPIGEQRHHLEWLNTNLEVFEQFTDFIRARAPRPVSFDPTPAGFVFYRTSVSSYPSAYCVDEMIAYNLDGPLHTDRREMLETLFHELFHVNDARRGAWSERALRRLYDSIRKRCAGDHDCFTTFTPHDTVVTNGTYYAFDARTGDVREYAAELALRYFLEHEAVFNPDAPKRPAFKCLANENGAAWQFLVDEFFGGVDLTPGCSQEG
jgi:hypothetical protein